MMEELQVRHRREQKDLQGRITQKKKNATKKTRKGVNDECERLERELKDRQQAETDALNGTILPQSIDALQITDPTSIANDKTDQELERKVTFSTSTKQEEQLELGETQQSKKPNRQKARLARRAAEQEAQSAAAAEEAANLPDLREQEMTAMSKHRERLALRETFIRPDGHCLFSACAHGLPAEAIKTSGPSTESYQNVRYATADFMNKHRDDFEPFLDEPFDGYVQKIKNTAEWGGQLELQAIAKSFHTTINVLQADGRVEKFEPDQSDPNNKEVWLAYYKHSFGLGEHYNALSKA